jgi:cyclopropane-fatty-acyl-phospholipid synthase
MGSFAGFEPLDENVHPRPAHAFDRWLLSLLHKSLGDAPVRLRLWDGTEHVPRARPLASLLVRDRKTLIGMLLDPDLNVGEAYTSGRLEVEGDLVAVNEAVFRALSHGGGYAMLPWWRFSGAGRHGLRASRDNIHHHYDIGNDFYRLWLDRQLVYTCAYFPTPTATLEEAQEAKMEYVCRKLDLKAGEKVVEAGCGWGSLALHMARHHGVTVRAFNISREQVRWARRRAEEEGLADRVEFVEDDYRNIGERCDAFVSVGMLEHVGLRNYRTLGDVIDRCLQPVRGRGLLHFIGRNRLQPLNAWIRKRIFPGAYPPTLRQVMEEILEPRSFSVLDVENLRLHYARTLRHWLHRFEGSAEEVVRMFDEPFVRAWRLYLAGSEAAFATGWMQLFQVTFARPDKDDGPWTRADLYRGAGPRR